MVFIQDNPIASLTKLEFYPETIFGSDATKVKIAGRILQQEINYSLKTQKIWKSYKKKKTHKIWKEAIIFYFKKKNACNRGLTSLPGLTTTQHTTMAWV